MVFSSTKIRISQGGKIVLFRAWKDVYIGTLYGYVSKLVKVGTCENLKKEKMKL